MSSGRGPPQDVGKNNTGAVEPFYTNEDVAVLHDIIVLAQELLPNLPERERLPTNALFTAYYDILPRVGVNADHDSRYARILFKIGGLRDHGTLYEKFEEVLARMGIEIEFGQEEDEGIYSQLEDSQTDFKKNAKGNAFQDENQLPRGRPRRNSESSVWDLGSGQFHLRERHNSFSSLRKPFRSSTDRGSRFLPEFVHAQPLKLDQSIVKANRDKSEHDVRSWLASDLEKPRRERGRGRSVSTHASLRIRRRSPSLATSHHGTPSNASILEPNDYEFRAQSETAAVTPGSNLQRSDSSNLSRRPSVLQEAIILMERKASLVLQQRRSLLAIERLRLWQLTALQLREDRANLQNVAIHHDKTVLLHSSLEKWQNRLLVARRSEETDGFFAYLEHRSEQARDFFLLNKAFTHWRLSAFEEVERTSIARRHIIRTRTFNAWRDITAINELKVRRQVIKRFFSIWKRQNTSLLSVHTKAVQRYETNLVEKIYTQWIRRGREIQADIWWSERAKRQILLRWTAFARTFWSHQCTAEEKRLLQLALGKLLIWRAKTHEQEGQNHDAESFYRIRTGSVSLRKWRRETLVIPAKNTLQTEVNIRVLRKAFSLWLYRSQQEREAVAVDRLRVVREAWANWRHKLRFQLLRARVDERVILESIYKWVLTERSMLAKRLTNRGLLTKVVGNWASRLKASRAQRWDQEDLAHAFADQKTQAFALNCWYSRQQAQQTRDSGATSFYTPRRLDQSFSRWSEHTRHLRKLDRWSRDAEFYFLASKSLKYWKVSTESAKRERRKTAYAQVRRTTKIHLARVVLLTWRHRAQEVMKLQVQAVNISQNKIVITGMNFFDQWRACAEELRELESLWRERLLRKLLFTWRDRTSAFQELKAEAIANFEERQQSRTIKRWSLSTLQIKAQSRYAGEIREKNFRRSFRKSFAYWQQRTVQKRPINSLHRNDPSQLGVTATAENWSDFGEDTEVDEWAKGLDEASISTPVPGYLNTPSKRTERVTAAAARFSSTTPKVRLSSPFERQLRAQYSGGLGPSLRKGPGKSQLSMGGGFTDISTRKGVNDYHEI